MPTNEMKPTNDHATGSHEAADEQEGSEWILSLPELAKGHGRLLSAYQQNPRSVFNEAIQSFTRIWENEAISRVANSVESGFDQPYETDDEADCINETSSEADFIFRVYTVGIGQNVRYRLCSHDGAIDEDWGLEGIERLLETYLGGDDDPFHTNFALHFYRETYDLMQGNYIMMTDIDDESDVINIRVIRADQEELRYPNRFIFFESSSWRNASCK